jgi:hypothetical protein
MHAVVCSRRPCGKLVVVLRYHLQGMILKEFIAFPMIAPLLR